MPETFRIDVNGAEHLVTTNGDTPLLYVLRNDLGLNGPKFGCGLAPICWGPMASLQKLLQRSSLIGYWAPNRRRAT